MKTFVEFINEDKNKDEMIKIEKALSKAKFNKVTVSRFGTYGDVLGITVMVEYPTKKEAEDGDVKGIIKILNKMYTSIELDKKDSDYTNGILVQSSHWKNNGPTNPHELYLSLTGAL